MKKYNIEKLIIPLLLVGVIIYLLYRIFKKSDIEIKEVNAVDNEIEKKRAEIRKLGIKPNEFSQTELLDFANRLEQAMFDVTTDEPEIYAVFSRLGFGVEGELDYLMLKKAFGHRPYTGGVFPNVLNVVGLSEGDNLQWWLNEELDEEEKATVNSILQSKQISYRI